MSGRNHVGAAWSAYQMVTYEPTRGAETCPLSAAIPSCEPDAPCSMAMENSNFPYLNGIVVHPTPSRLLTNVAFHVASNVALNPRPEPAV